MIDIRRRKTWGLVAVVAIAAVILAGLGLPMLRESVEAEGGDILARTSDAITVRCLGPEVTLSLNNFEGEVTFTNCFPNSTLTGQDGAATVIGSITSCHVDGSKTELSLSAQAKESFKFAVMGDSQGYNDILAEALMQVGGCEFIIHCGDMTPSGQPSEYDSFHATLGNVAIPVMTTPGNHDVKLNGSDEYTSRFGTLAYSFEYSGIRFAFVDSSDQVISEEEIDWLGEVFEGAEKKVLVTHMPSYDPFGDNHTLDTACVPPPSPHIEVIGKDGSRLNLTYDDLMLMDLLEADSSYENAYNNIAGQGHYKGVLVRDLLELVGGMAEDDLIETHGHRRILSGLRVPHAYPDTTGPGLQGEIIQILSRLSSTESSRASGPKGPRSPCCRRTSCTATPTAS